MATAMTYPISYEVEPQLSGRNRVTALFRFFMAIPHLLIVSALGSVAQVMAFFSWLVIIFTGSMPRGMWDFIAGYMRWKSRSTAYLALHRDEFPPFSFEEEPYGARFVASEFPEARNRLTVLLRLIWLVPHIMVLALLGMGWLFTYLLGWLLVIVTGSYPAGLYNFSVGFVRWSTRVEAYGLLMTDEYPPFSMS